MITTDPSATDLREPKRLYRLVEPSYDDIRAHDPAEFLSAAVERTLERFGEDYGIEEAVAARREGHAWVPVGRGPRALLQGLEALDPEERELLQSNRVVFGTRPFFSAVWLLGSRREWSAVFRLSRPPEEEAALLLQMTRIAVAQRASETVWANILDRSREIQRSLLPDPLPALKGFDLAARSDSAEVVGGDVFDAIRLGPDSLGLMIADASGHGFPAALEARDVVVGLRMGAAGHLKIDSTIERLNEILCSSTLSSRFISLVYGELESGGEFDYINAGHPAPMILEPGGRERLTNSGRVLGVSFGSRYRVSHAQVPPGGILLLYTDGVTECPSPLGEEFGVERLAGIGSVLAGSSAAHICTAIFEALGEHAAGLPLPDDASVLVARRLA
ncbi:MAG TPA: PP2C family protein-serine/threonine phosphatase [Thermoanaerobaculia bacterium]|nr:PP2C family protein-serine/threonine phosphatase [Thermoanaerobaculia bacterium]